MVSLISLYHLSSNSCEIHSIFLFIHIRAARKTWKEEKTKCKKNRAAGPTRKKKKGNDKPWNRISFPWFHGLSLSFSVFLWAEGPEGQISWGDLVFFLKRRQTAGFLARREKTYQESIRLTSLPKPEALGLKEEDPGGTNARPTLLSSLGRLLTITYNKEQKE